ncbi:MAG: FAD-binding oxidoreductase [Xanthomonadales bacterium]|nr:FAD-binding oxidoreductase [Xanthomonadales bacterium]
MIKPPAPSEHTQSYYAATANWGTDYPVLEGGQSVDICVVGGGFTGVSAALTLVERGYSVALVEANRVGWGASGRNGGQLIHGFSSDAKLAAQLGPAHDVMLWDMAWRGHQIIRERVSRFGIDCDLKPGFLEVACKPSHMRYFEDQFEQFQRHGHDHEYRLLDEDETSELIGTSAYHGGFLTMGNGHLHPLNLCIGEARAAEQLGARIYEHSPVTRIEHGRRPRVHTENGHVEADAVVLAGNAYHQLEGKHLSGLTFPAGSYIIATEPLPEDLRREINPRDVAVCDSNEIVDYFRLSADGRMLYGGRCNYSGRDPKSIQAAILPRMLEVYPQLKGFGVDFEWGGKIGIVLNRIPLLGRIEGNVYYAQGYSGHGVNATHVMGEIIADAIGGTLERFDLFAERRHFRIPGGQWLGNQVIALGMLYFRLKDRLA